MSADPAGEGLARCPVDDTGRWSGSATHPAALCVEDDLWKAYAAGALSDDSPSERKLASAPKAPPPPKARRQRSPRQVSIARRRHRAASGPMPPALAARFTQAETATFRIVADEVRHHGVCALHIAAIAARVGTCGIPPILAARARLRPRRVEPCRHGLEHQADARAQPRLSAFELVWIAASGNLPPAVIPNRSDNFQQINRSIRSRFAGT
jgi:hypothetical protein